MLFEINQLHLNTPKGVWTIIADVYAIALILLAITGMFVLKGRLASPAAAHGSSRPACCCPLVYWVYHLYLE